MEPVDELHMRMASDIVPSNPSSQFFYEMSKQYFGIKDFGLALALVNNCPPAGPDLIDVSNIQVFIIPPKKVIKQIYLRLMHIYLNVHFEEDPIGPL